MTSKTKHEDMFNSPAKTVSMSKRLDVAQTMALSYI